MKLTQRDTSGGTCYGGFVKLCVSSPELLLIEIIDSFIALAHFTDVSNPKDASAIDLGHVQL